MTKLGSITLASLALVMASVFMYLCINALDAPVVQMSNRTGECVQIIYKGLTYECTSLKGKEGYSIEVVK